MKVYVLSTGIYDGREIEGVYTSLEAAQAQYPDVVWEQDEKRYSYQKNEPPLWEDERRGWDRKDCHIEEHELDGWAASEHIETYEDELRHDLRPLGGR